MYPTCELLDSRIRLVDIGTAVSVLWAFGRLCNLIYIQNRIWTWVPFYTQPYLDVGTILYKTRFGRGYHLIQNQI